MRHDKSAMRPFAKLLWSLVFAIMLLINNIVNIITHAGIVVGVGKVFSCVCLFVRALKGNRLKLSTPNSVHVYIIAVARHALTHRSKVTRLRKPTQSHGC